MPRGCLVSSFKILSHILLTLSLFVAAAELDSANFCVVQRAAVVVQVLCDRETRHVLFNSPDVLDKVFPQSAPSITYVDDLAATAGDAMIKMAVWHVKASLVLI